MALIKCKGCGQMVSTKAEKCPKCSYPIARNVDGNVYSGEQNFENTFVKRSHTGLVVFVILLLALLGGGVYFYFAKLNTTPTVVVTRQFADEVNKYQFVWNFSEGLAAVIDETGLFGFINEKGEEVIPCKYIRAGDFSEGLARVRDANGKYGFINKKGEKVIPCKYNSVRPFSEGLAAIDANGKCGFINKKGEEVVPCKYNNVRPFSEGLAAIKDTNGKFGFINKKGEEVIPCKYSWSIDFSEGLAIIVDDNEKFGFVNKKGEEVIPCKYSLAGFFSEGLAIIVDDNEKFGFINKKGEEVIPCKYHNAEDFSEGVAVVTLDEKSGYIDKTGNSTFSFIKSAKAVREELASDSLAVDAEYDDVVVRDSYKVEEVWESYTHKGTMTDANGTYPIEMTFEQKGNELRNCIYKNVDLGGKIRMDGGIVGDDLVFTGKDGNNSFRIIVNRYSLEGYAQDGDKRLQVSLSYNRNENQNTLQQGPSWLQGTWIYHFDEDGRPDHADCIYAEITVKGSRLKVATRNYGSDFTYKYEGTWQYKNEGNGYFISYFHNGGQGIEIDFDKKVLIVPQHKYVHDGHGMRRIYKYMRKISD